MRKEIMILGLVGLVGCEERTDVSRVDRNVNLTKPEDCYEVKDINCSEGSQNECRYQVLCTDANGKLTLYDRHCTAEGWRKINVK